jgi:hypothetical protein
MPSNVATNHVTDSFGNMPSNIANDQVTNWFTNQFSNQFSNQVTTRDQLKLTCRQVHLS